MHKKIHKCPKCGGMEFAVTAHVTQDWVVDEHGDFTKVIKSCVEVTHRPNDEDMWQCHKCGYDAAGSKFLTDES